MNTILSTAINPDETCVSVMQKDSLVLNIFLYDPSFGSDYSKKDSSRRSRYHSPALTNNSYIYEYNASEPYSVKNGRKALILAPFQRSLNQDLDKIKNSIKKHFSEGVEIIDDMFADITKFREDYLNDYDMILINTHGGVGFETTGSFTNWMNKQGYYDSNFSHNGYSTILSSGTVYSPITASELVDNGLLSWDEVALSKIEGSRDFYLCMTPYFIKNSSLKNAYVFVTACESSRVNGGDGSMINAFIEKGDAAFYSGYDIITANDRAKINNHFLFDYLAHGLSIQDAFGYVANSEYINDYCQKLYDFYSNLSDEDKIKYEVTEENLNSFFGNLQLFANERFKNIPCFLFDPFPTLNDVNPSNDQVLLSWECNLTPFDIYLDEFEMYQSKKITFSITYDVFVNGSKIIDDNESDKTVSWIPNTKGKNTWCVVAHMKKDGEEFVTFTSKEGSFELSEEVSPIAEAIDLGLPSGTKWASWNVGASKPEEYGGYYAWGETEEKDHYDWSTYTHCDGSWKTCHHIGNDIAGTEYDVAHKKWGGEWRMPTKTQQDELRKNCTETWTQLNGVNGILVTGPNGNSIFLPAAGSHQNDGLKLEGENGFYWSSLPYTYYLGDEYIEGDAYLLPFDSDHWSWGYGNRYFGHSVRAVITPQDCPDDHHPHMIDLGLPSGTKWACCNIGASNPEEYGGYYSWGETEEKDYYNWSTYTHCDGSSYTCHHIGDDIAGTEYDVAHVKWGGSWRMPTKAQQEELSGNCTRVRTQKNGVDGIKVIGPNGNTIFLPAAGYRLYDYLFDTGGRGYYWSSLCSNVETQAYFIAFDSGNWYWDDDYRYNGLSVRAVSPQSQNLFNLINNPNSRGAVGVFLTIPPKDTAYYLCLRGNRVGGKH